MAGIYDEGIARDIALIREVFAGSGININANFNVGDVVGITNAAGDPIDPARLQDINNLRLDTARIVQPSGQLLAARSDSVVLASNHPIVPVSITISGVQPVSNALAVSLGTDHRIIPVSVTVSGQQISANSSSVVLASNVIP